MTSRLKHIAIRYHCFRQFITTNDGEDGGIMVKKIGTKDQLADIFTKGLGPILFEDLRERLCGWTSSIELKPPIAQAREGVKR